MKWRISIVLPAILAALQGCGGGGSTASPPAAPAPLSGVLQFSGISGVRYASASQSGVTDAAGTFRYLSGETVTFAVGGTTLGSAPGAPVISVFTLAGATPPTTERALRLELDLARRKVTPLVKATNIARLLIALDRDNDPTNGIDVGGLAGNLSGIALDFDVGLLRFSSRLQKVAPGLARNIPLRYPLVHLYRAARIVVPAHAPTEKSTSPPGLPPSLVYLNFYGEDGALVEQRSAPDPAVARERAKWTYDALGRVMTVDRLVPNVMFPPRDEREVREYDSRGGLVSTTSSVDVARDGVVDDVSITSYTRDDFGFAIGEKSREESGSQLLRDVVTTATYDSRHNLVSTTREFNPTSLSRHAIETESRTYDSTDRLLNSSNESRSVDDDSLIARTTLAYTYGNDSQTEVLDQDTRGGGANQYRTTTTSSFDDAANTIGLISEYDYLVDGVVDQRRADTFAYDRDRRRLLQEERSTSSSGSTERRIRYEYDDLGNLVSEVFENRSAGGEFRVSISYTYSYGPDGELLELTVASDTSNYSDRYVQTPVADGVLLLSQAYWEPPGEPVSVVE